MHAIGVPAFSAGTDNRLAFYTNLLIFFGRELRDVERKNADTIDWLTVLSESNDALSVDEDSSATPRNMSIILDDRTPEMFLPRSG